MKVLSIRQPYATLVCAGVKDVENRSWTTDYRGPLLIHATQWSAGLFDKKLPLPVFHEYDRCISSDGEQVKESEIIAVRDDTLILLNEDYRLQFDLLKREIRLQADEETTAFPMQSIVGQVTLSDIIENHDSPWSERGHNHWLFTNAQLFEEPIVGVKGKLRLWTYDR